MKKRLYSALLSSVLVIALVYTTACGTLLYPDRHGQARGDIDPAVLIMNGALLFVGVVPGLIAFIVDFHTNAIYLPPGGGGSDLLTLPDNLSGMRVVYVDEGLTSSSIESVLRREIGTEVKLSTASWTAVARNTYGPDRGFRLD